MVIYAVAPNKVLLEIAFLVILKPLTVPVVIELTPVKLLAISHMTPELLINLPVVPSYNGTAPFTDDVIDEEGIFDLYSNYDYKENKKNDRYHLFESLV